MTEFLRPGSTGCADLFSASTDFRADVLGPGWKRTIITARTIEKEPNMVAISSVA